MTFKKQYEKDPDAVLDYGIDWADWVTAADSIITSSWTAPAGITVETDSLSGTVCIVWLSGGTAGVSYEVTCHIETDDGRQDDRSLIIKCIER